MGLGLVLMVAPDDRERVLAAIPEARAVGEVKAWTGRSVELDGLG
jgi:phosphoribosylaminoimidazole (AIR) synthetase